MSARKPSMLLFDTDIRAIARDCRPEWWHGTGDEFASAVADGPLGSEMETIILRGADESEGERPADICGWNNGRREAEIYLMRWINRAREFAQDSTETLRRKFADHLDNNDSDL